MGRQICSRRSKFWSSFIWMESWRSDLPWNKSRLITIDRPFLPNQQSRIWHRVNFFRISYLVVIVVTVLSTIWPVLWFSSQRIVLQSTRRACFPSFEYSQYLYILFLALTLLWRYAGYLAGDRTGSASHMVALHGFNDHPWTCSRSGFYFLMSHWQWRWAVRSWTRRRLKPPVKIMLDKDWIIGMNRAEVSPAVWTTTTSWPDITSSSLLGIWTIISYVSLIVFSPTEASPCLLSTYLVPARIGAARVVTQYIGFVGCKGMDLHAFAFASSTQKPTQIRTWYYNFLSQCCELKIDPSFCVNNGGWAPVFMYIFRTILTENTIQQGPSEVHHVESLIRTLSRLSPFDIFTPRILCQFPSCPVWRQE